MRTPWNNETSFEWYQHIEKQLKNNMGIRQYSRIHNICKTTYSNFYCRVIGCQLSNPEKYKIMIETMEKFMVSDLTYDSFCYSSKITRADLHTILAHFSIWKRIDEQMIVNGIDPLECPYNPFNHLKNREMGMNFIKLKSDRASQMSEKMSRNRTNLQPKEPTDPREPAEPKEEYIKARNDIEISISYGIKVFLPSDLEGEKILKVINFLKEL